MYKRQKWTYGAFASTDLERELRARGVERVLLCGCLTNVCVAATAREAVDRYFRVCVVDDACGAVDARLHDAALELMSAPQRATRGHMVDAPVGLYFAERALVADVEAALASLSPAGAPACAPTCAPVCAPVAAAAAAALAEDEAAAVVAPESTPEAAADDDGFEPLGRADSFNSVVSIGAIVASDGPQKPPRPPSLVAATAPSI